MKKFLTLTFMLLTFVASMIASTRYYGDLNGDGEVTIHDATALIRILLGGSDNSNGASDLDHNGSVSLTDLSQVVDIILGVRDKEAMADVDTIYITYADGTATYQIPSAWADSVTISISGGDVTLTNTCTTAEYITCLSGTCSDGSFTYTGSYKTTLVLNGLSLTNSDGAAIDIQCGKRIALELADGTTNTLTDGSGSQKAALNCQGHLEVSKGGSLTVTGNTKHAIRSKEYILLKKTLGSITVDGSANDGIHCGQYFQMNGGEVTVTGVTGDAIQAEMELDGTEDDGKIIIKGGTLSLQVDNTSTAALKCDSTLHVTGGDITITTTGNSDKAMKSDYNIEIDGGDITITQSGTYTVDAVVDSNGNTTYDPSYVTALKADSAIVITDGTLTVTNTADGGKGLSADGDIRVEGGTVTVNAYGTGGVLDTSGANVVESGETSTSSYKVYITLPSTATSSNSGGGGFNPGGNSSTTLSWSNVQLWTSSGTLVATLSEQVSIAGTDGTTSTFYLYDFGTATSGSYYFTASYSASTTSGGGMGMGGGSSTTTTTGTYTSDALTLSLTGEDVFYAVTATSSSSGGQGGQPGQQQSVTLSFSISNVTSTYSGGSVAADEGDTYSAACLKSDADIILSGGTLGLAHSGTISKGIKADGTVTLSGTTVTDTASGSYMIVGSDPSYCTAVKCGAFEGTGGSLTVEAIGAASRGVSSDGTLTISGGTYSIALKGDGALYNNDSEGVGSRGLKSDGNMQLLAGTIEINSSAIGGKGIKVGNSTTTSTLTIGTSGASNDMLSLDVNTTGQYISTESSSSSGGMGGGDMSEGFIGSAKAIKVMGAITVNSGNIHLSTKSDGAEGLESKSTITFNGGVFESDTYDDAINAASTITFNDGYVWGHASDNDAIDSNDGTTGIVVNGGVVIGTSTSDPEEAFDCDDAAFVLNGGVLIGVGGAQGGGGGGWGGSTSTAGAPTSASQPYAMVSSVSPTSGKYICLKNSSGTVLCSYKMPQSLSSVNILVSHPSLTSGSTATVVYNADSVSGTTSSVWDGAYSTGGTVSGGTSTSVSPSN